jgi:hypothetical protein
MKYLPSRVLAPAVSPSQAKHTQLTTKKPKNLETEQGLVLWAFIRGQDLVVVNPTYFITDIARL